MIDHSSYINKIREFGYSPAEISEHLNKATRKMPEDLQVVFKDWNTEISKDKDTSAEIIEFVRENSLFEEWKSAVLEEIEEEKYRHLLGWSARAYFTRQFMIEKVNSVGDDASMVEDFLRGI